MCVYIYIEVCIYISMVLPGFILPVMSFLRAGTGDTKDAVSLCAVTHGFVLYMNSVRRRSDYIEDVCRCFFVCFLMTGDGVYFFLYSRVCFELLVVQLER